MSVIRTRGRCPDLPDAPNCQPVFVHRRDDELIAAVLRIKREGEHRAVRTQA